MASREVVCYHEAGHIAAYLAYGIPIDNVWIWESREHQGEWEGGVFDDDAKAKEPRLQMIVKLVAPATDMKRFGDYFTGDKKDIEAAQSLCSAENIDFDDAMRESQRFVDAPDKWAAIERIAHRLLMQQPSETMEFRQIVEVCGEVLQEWFRMEEA